MSVQDTDTGNPRSAFDYARDNAEKDVTIMVDAAVKISKRLCECGRKYHSSPAMSAHKLTCEAAQSAHKWHIRFGLTCCEDCGIVQRADGENSPCKGIVTLRPMEKPL